MDKIFCIGDIHGDLRVFLAVLNSIGIIDSDSYYQVLNFILQNKTVYEGPDLKLNKQFTGTVIFMGDLIDSKRKQNDPENIDDIAYSEEYIINQLIRLKKLCSKIKTINLVIIIGNHEMSVAVEETLSNPKNYRSLYKLSDTCDKSGHEFYFCRKRWKRKIQTFLLNFAVPLHIEHITTVISKQKISYNIAFCHGGLDPLFVDEMKNIYPRLRKIKPNTNYFWDKVKDASKSFYDNVIEDAQKEESGKYQNKDLFHVNKYRSMDYTLDWSRIHAFQSSNKINAFSYFLMYVCGHSADDYIRIKNLKDKDRATSGSKIDIVGTGKKKDFEAIKIFVDCKLSRAFDTSENLNRRKEYLYINTAKHLQYLKVPFTLK